MPRCAPSSFSRFTGSTWPVRLMTWQQRIMRVRAVMRGGECLDNLVFALAGHRQRERHQLDAFAGFALPEGVEHPRIVLIGRQHLIARLEVDAELADLQRLRTVPRDRDLLRVHSPCPRQPRPHRLTARRHQCPQHVGRGQRVRFIKMPLHGLLHHSGRRADAPVVQVDHAAVHREGLLRENPEVLIIRPAPVGTRLAKFPDDRRRGGRKTRPPQRASRRCRR
jgi:hypothetical protein